MTYHMFLDDERQPWSVTWVKLPDAVWEIVRNFEEFTYIIETRGVPEFITFDHDLADAHYVAMLEEVSKHSTSGLIMLNGDLEITDEPEVDYGPEKTGYECAKWLVDYCINKEIKFPEYAVHSMNPIGSKRIKDYIEWAKGKVDTL